MKSIFPENFSSRQDKTLYENKDKIDSKLKKRTKNSNYDPSSSDFNKNESGTETNKSDSERTLDFTRYNAERSPQNKQLRPSQSLLFKEDKILGELYPHVQSWGGKIHEVEGHLMTLKYQQTQITNSCSLDYFLIKYIIDFKNK